jgi:hypothetical protein
LDTPGIWPVNLIVFAVWVSLASIAILGTLLHQIFYRYMAIRVRWFRLIICSVEMFPSEFEPEQVSQFVTFLVADQSRNNDPLFI